MKLVRIGSKGVNVENIQSWEVSQEEKETNEMNYGPARGTGELQNILTLTYVSGKPQKFEGDEATALQQWLERNSDDASKPGTTTNKARRKT